MFFTLVGYFAAGLVLIMFSIYVFFGTVETVGCNVLFNGTIFEKLFGVGLWLFAGWLWYKLFTSFPYSLQLITN